MDMIIDSKREFKANMSDAKFRERVQIKAVHVQNNILL